MLQILDRSGWVHVGPLDQTLNGRILWDKSSSDHPRHEGKVEDRIPSTSTHVLKFLRVPIGGKSHPKLIDCPNVSRLNQRLPIPASKKDKLVAALQGHSIVFIVLSFLVKRVWTDRTLLIHIMSIILSAKR